MPLLPDLSASHRRLNKIGPRLLSTAIAALTITLLSAGGMTPALAQGQQERELVRRGEGRADIWFYFQENDPSSKLIEPHLRVQRPWELPEGWKMNWRVDVPLKYTNESGKGNPGGGWDAGFGDMYAQVAITTPDLLASDDWRGLNINAGFRLIMPTGARSPFGSSQWQAAPQLGFGFDRKITENVRLELSPLVRHFIGFSPTHADITTKRTFDIYPTVTLYLPEDWAITLWDENPMTYNARSNSWFVPLDVMVVKRFGKYFQAGVGASMRVIDTDENYKYMVYGRLSMFF